MKTNESMSQEQLYSIALTRLSLFNLTALLQLYKAAGSATAIFENHKDIRKILPDASTYLVEALQRLDQYVDFAAKELEYDDAHGIDVICFNDANYPQRLRECNDAPLVLYQQGSTDLNKLHTINIIGTRNCTSYGRDLIRSFVRDLQSLCPDTLVFSGLAYGVDICAHRECLANGLPTVGVVAHGLDFIYPRTHTPTATEMCEQGGGVITEYPINTQPKPKNFVQRNRIVAGCSDATLLVESANKGGGIITCSIARSYSRDVFAFPGAIGAEYSEGCNRLIRDNEANLITSAFDFVKAMNWENDLKLEKAHQNGIERTLFPTLTEEEKQIVEALQTHNDLQINMLSVQTNLPIARLTALLFELEMKGIIRTMAGGCYHLLS